MTDTSWEGESSEAPPRKKGMPKWLWFCGGGCLLMLLVGAGAAFFGVRAVKQWADPDVQWAKLAEVVPYDEPRPDYILVPLPVGFIPGFEGAWTLTDGKRSATFMVFEGELAESGELFDPEQNEVDFGKVFGNMGQHDFETGTVVVQGRELEVARFRSHPLDEEDSPEEEDEEAEEETGVLAEIGKSLRKGVARIDITPEGEVSRVVMLQFERTGSLERITDEEIVEFLEPFHIGPER